MSNGVYAWSHGTGGVHFHRLAEPIRGVRLHGIKADTGNRLSDLIQEEYETIVVHMLHDPDASEAWEKLAAYQRNRMVFDCDDAMWDPDWRPFRNAYGKHALDRLLRNVMLAHVVTTPSERIAEYLGRFNPNVHVVPNTVPEALTRRRMRDRPRPTIGYQGSPSHVTDITPEFEFAIGRFMREFPDWVFKLWGADPKMAGPRTFVVPWQPSIAEYYKTLSMDIGLGPLRPSYFNSCKSSLRAIEYAALGIIPVLSDLDPYRGWIEHGVNGYLVRPGESWFEPLAALAADPDLRRMMAFNAWNSAASWTTEANVWRWTYAWSSV